MGRAGGGRVLQAAGDSQPAAITTTGPAGDRERQAADCPEDERNLRHVVDGAANGPQRTAHDLRNPTLRERKERRDRAHHPLDHHSRQVNGVGMPIGGARADHGSDDLDGAGWSSVGERCTQTGRDRRRLGLACPLWSPTPPVADCRPTHGRRGWILVMRSPVPAPRRNAGLAAARRRTGATLTVSIAC